MSLEKLFADRKPAIVKRWFELTIETYPKEAAPFLKNKKGRFANPIGYIFSQELESLIDGIFQEVHLESLKSSLENIIRIRAVQEFSPSQAIAFVFLLKQALREEMDQEIQEGRFGRELLELESRIDELALLSFNIFMKYREKIYELKANELKKQTFRLLERAKLVGGDPPDVKTDP